MGYRRKIAILAVALGLLAAGCREGPTVAERRAAILSVYFHALGYDPAAMGPDRRPIPLDRAAAILRDDARPIGAAIRGRAARRLVLGGLRITADHRPVLRFRSYIDTLAPVSVEEVEARIRRVIDEAARAHPGAPLAELSRVVHERLPEPLFELLIPKAIGACSDTTEDITTPMTASDVVSRCGHPDASWKKGLIAVAVQVDVRRDLRGLAVAMDPQSWSACNDLFAQSRYVEEDPQDGAWKGVGCPPGPGTEWDAGLYEHFVMEWANGNDSQFVTILDIETDLEPDAHTAVGPLHYEMEYCLDESQVVKIGDDLDGALDVDEGFSRADSIGEGWQSVLATKMVRFSGWPKAYDANVWAEVLLTAMGDQVREGACCEPPPPACAAPPFGP